MSGAEQGGRVQEHETGQVSLGFLLPLWAQSQVSDEGIHLQQGTCKGTRVYLKIIISLFVICTRQLDTSTCLHTELKQKMSWWPSKRAGRGNCWHSLHKISLGIEVALG